MFENLWTSNPKSGWWRSFGLLNAVGAVVLLTGLFSVATARAQDAQPQTTSTSDQLGQQTQQNVEVTTDQTANDQATAEQIITILEQDPQLLSEVKNNVAQLSGVDPTSISDEALFERIRQDAPAREVAVRELVARGYTLNSPPGSSAASTAETRINPAQQRNAAPAVGTPASPYDNRNDPQVQRETSPYKNMPSLTDLYSQFPAPVKKLTRFGSEAFVNGARNQNEFPIDIPAGPDYVLGPGDSITVNMWGGRSDRLSRVIDRQGQIALPEAGTIALNGMTIAQAQDAIQRALDRQFQGEHVEISLGRVRTVRIYVVGDVQRPGAYDVSSLSTPLNALYAAGGPTSHGSLRVLRQVRGGQLVRQIDLYDFLLKGVRPTDDRLMPGDTILVPPVGPQVSVEGMVQRPAIYELNGEQSLDQVLSLAGGVLASASLKRINVERIEAHETRTMFSLQLPDNPDAAKQNLESFALKDGDDVVIKQILPYNAQAVYLTGHVYHPGKYPYHDGMTLTDLIHSYQDIMPEPSDHAELIRLLPPDYRPQTISFNLAEVLIGNNPIPLLPMDLVRIYGRYEIDSPKVTINGEVLRPGEYPMSQGMTVSQLIQMAGGFRRSAYRQTADLSSYVVQDGQRVLLQHSEIAAEKAMEGDKSADATLKPGDVVNIRTVAGWQDIGATVVVSGEVEHPGGYGIQAGERLSSVLKRAGGFRADAYPYAAVMQRVQVRELNEQARQQMIRRIEQTPIAVTPGVQAGSQTATDLQKSLELQRQQILADLRDHPPGGRLVVNITSDIDRWANTSADIELRAGDTLFIPKRASFVMASGQVYNPVAISYVPGKRFGWYLSKAGGVTPQGNNKDLYVLRADGTVVPKHGRTWGGGSFMSLGMRPGDTIFVPEKIQGASQLWQNIVGTAQVISAITLPLAFAGVL